MTIKARYTGEIVFWNAEKGHGVIWNYDSGFEMFVSARDVRKGQAIEKGAHVDFGHDGVRFRALDVTVINAEVAQA